MKNLYKAGMHRLLKNIIFIGGCIIAFVATFVFTANIPGFTGRFERLGPEGRMFFISVAMIGFFTIFVPLYTNAEYRDGTIRNKIISGFSQKEIYLSTLFSHFTGLGIMMLWYFVAGIIGGAKISAELILSNIILFFALCGYISAMELIAMWVQKTYLVAVFAFLILNVTYYLVMMGNFFMAFVLKGTAAVIGRVIYNISAFGQWMVHSGFSDDVVNPGGAAQVIISLVVVLITAFIGTVGINKRDLS